VQIIHESDNSATTIFTKSKQNKNVIMIEYVSLAEAARMKGVSTNLLKYHLGKDNAPQPAIVCPRAILFERQHIEAWNPVFKIKKIKGKPKTA
jgi:hypothetical protein